MTNSKNSFLKRFLKAPIILSSIFLILGFVGVLDASYITINDYRGTTLPCSVLKGCDVVTTSKYSRIGNIPVSLIGVGYYVALIVLAIAYLDTRKHIALKAGIFLTSLGFLASGWFMYVQYSILKTFCLYCVISASTSTLLFASSMLYVYREKLLRRTVADQEKSES